MLTRKLLLCFALLCAAGHAAAIKMSREGNAELLAAALADPETHFHLWATRHHRPYAAVPLDTLLRVGASSSSATGAFDSGRQVLLQRAWRQRQAIWLDNARFAAQYNERNAASGHWLGLNALSDLSFDEYKRLLGTKKRPAPSSSTGQQEQAATSSSKGQQLQQQEATHGAGPEPGFMYSDVDLSSIPRSLDWRNHSAVTHVKNQGMCGSCWAFATTGAIEGINALYTHDLVALSEQELVDCDRAVDMGCEGGMMDNAYQWIMETGGIHTEDDWPYTAAESPEGCPLELHRKEKVVTIDGYQDVPVGDEAALLKAVAHQPVAVAVEADSRAFQLYVGGVMADPGCGSDLNHGVLVVGYGGLDHGGHIPTHTADPANGPYWIIKNSWGPAWGAEGYIKIQMGYKDNSTGMHGLCGITLAASFPIKRNPNPPAPRPGPSPHPKPHPPKPTPPPPKPGPVMCDEEHACPPENTCCCLDNPSSAASSGCNTWGCCPMANAVCCPDHQHCCPHELPVCDAQMGRCSQQAGSNAGLTIPWMRNQPALKVAPRTASSSQQATPVRTTSLRVKHHVPQQVQEA